MRYSNKLLLFKLSIFVLPFILFLLLDAFLLPPTLFTFRAWEALKVGTFYPTLTGPFYPNQSIDVTEQGELAPYTPYAVPKQNVWITDAYGYRNLPGQGRADVLLLGDSFSAGVKLDQSELLAVVLGNKIGQPVYNMAPAPGGFTLMDNVLATDRFRQSPPKVVILQRNEGFLHLMQPVNPADIAFIRMVHQRAARLPRGSAFNAVAIGIDRFQKRNWYHWASSKIDRAIQPKELIVHGNEVFMFGDTINNPTPPAELDRLTRVVISYRDTLQKMGIAFVFVPTPNKENIYHQLLPSRRKPVLLTALIGRLRAAGVPVVDLQTPFDSAHAAGVILYPRDDNHWSPQAVQIAAAEVQGVIQPMLRKQEGIPPGHGVPVKHRR
jgi:hypothetical protein